MWRSNFSIANFESGFEGLHKIPSSWILFQLLPKIPKVSLLFARPSFLALVSCNDWPMCAPFSSKEKRIQGLLMELRKILTRRRNISIVMAWWRIFCELHCQLPMTQCACFVLPAPSNAACVPLCKLPLIWATNGDFYDTHLEERGDSQKRLSVAEDKEARCLEMRR